MADVEIERWMAKEFEDLYGKGRLNLQPEYQRGRVWNDAQRYALIDTVMQGWPIGVVLLREEEDKDTEGTSIKKWDVVDGQQRVTTLIEYNRGQSIETAPAKQVWSVVESPKAKGFKAYNKLSKAGQDRFDEYKVPVARLKEYEVDTVKEIYQRLQTGKPLNIGERIKALKTDARDSIRELTKHKLFDLAAKRHQFRDGHWNLAAQFFKSAYQKDPLTRVEFEYLKEFCSNSLDKGLVQSTLDAARKVMNGEYRILAQAVEEKPGFESTVASARTLKWCFAVLYQWQDRYSSLLGREHLAAQGVMEYFEAKEKEDTPEWKSYVNTGRTGRMDTEAVKECLNYLTAHMVNTAKAESLDSERYFTYEQRMQIWDKSDKSCTNCKIPLTVGNFHADHVKPYIQGGQTVVSNGQVLCVRCNLAKGGTGLLFNKNSGD